MFNRIACLLLFLTALTSNSIAQEKNNYLELPAIGVSLKQPQGFTKADRFEGLIHEQSGSSIFATRLATSSDKLVIGFTKESLAKQGMKLLARQKVVVDGKTGLLLLVSQKFQKIDFRKWIVVTGDDRVSFTIVASFPRSSSRAVSGLLKSTILETRISTNVPPQDEELGFSVGKSEKLEPAKTQVAGTRTKLYLRKGSRSLLPNLFLSSDNQWQKSQFATLRISRSSGSRKCPR